MLSELESVFVSANQILTSFTLILVFSMLVFVLTYNRKSTIGLPFAVLLGCMCFTYTGDVALFQVRSFDSALPWLKFQWIGIAFTPAAYLHFSDALLRTTNDVSKIRRNAVMGSYISATILLYLVFFTDLLVRDGFFQPGIIQFKAGPLFLLFTLYFYGAVLWGFFNAQRAKNRCLTTASRNRMTWLMLSFAAPSFGIFPYMLLANQVTLAYPIIILTTLFVLNLGIDFIIVFMAYNVSFFDAFAPDRVVKYVLVTYLLRGPLIATLVIMIILALPDQTRIWGVPRDDILTSIIVVIILLAQVTATHLKPIIGSLIYRNERDEINLLRRIDTGLLTTTDLQQALENILITICELLRVRTGFVANVAAQSGPRLEAFVGQEADVQVALTNFNQKLFPANGSVNGHQFITHENFWYIPLQTKAKDRYLGLLGVVARTESPDFTPYERETMSTLVHQAEFVLEDRHLQRNIFNTLRGFVSDIERAQRLRNAVRYIDSPVDNLLEVENRLINQDDFLKMVHEALSHYWGGPKLTNSPLLGLAIVQKAVAAHDGDAVKALRSILADAIENTRPSGERHMTTPEWLLYNILELKFIQGHKVRDIANRLARSEADLYRKQKIAIEAVARSLSEMEQRDLLSEDKQQPLSNGTENHTPYQEGEG